MKERAEKMQIDLGGNVLPGFVSGSKDIETCAERLRTLYSAGIAAAVLTPRYYPAKMSVEEFIVLRDNHPAFAKVRERGNIGIPCFVKEDGSVFISLKHYDASMAAETKPEYAAGAACNLDGTGC